MTVDHVVFVPGYLLDSRLWESAIRALGDRVTAHVPELGPFSSIGEMAESILERAPGRFALVGLSMGGYVSLEVVRRAGERVRKLALVNSQAGVDAGATLERRSALRAMVEAGELERAKDSLRALMLHPDHLAVTHPARRALDAMYADCDAALFLRHQHALNTRCDNSDALPAIRCPTLVIGSRQDRLTPPAVQQAMAARIPGARLVIFESSGHLTPIEKPEALARTLAQWLSEAP